MIEMRVIGLTFDAELGSNILVLRALDCPATLACRLDLLEAMELSLALENDRNSKRLSLDLMLLCLKALGVRVAHVEIIAKKTGVYLAVLILQYARTTLRIECRVAEALIVALRTGTSIQVSETVVKEAEESQYGGTIWSISQRNQEMQTPDPVNDLLRKIGADREKEKINAVLRRTGTLPDNNKPGHDKKLLELLRCLEPASNHKM